MTPRPPGKAAQAMQRLREENAALRDLLAAVQETAEAGSDAHGPGDRFWHPGWLAAVRISVWLGDDMDAGQLATAAGTFREHAGEFVALGVPAPAVAYALPQDEPRFDAGASCPRHPGEHASGCPQCAAAPRLTGADVLLAAAAELDSEMRETADPGYLEDAASQDEDEDDGGCLTLSPAGSACLRAAGHDVINGSAHRDANGRKWDDSGWFDPAAVRGLQDPAPVVRVLGEAGTEDAR